MVQAGLPPQQGIQQSYPSQSFTGGGTKGNSYCPSPTYTMPYRLRVTANNTGSQTGHCPVTGTIKKISVGFPNGTLFTVEVVFRRGNEQFLPTPIVGTVQGIAFDNYTEVVYLEYPVEKDDEIELFITNSDTVNAWTIAALIHLEEQTKK